MTALTVPAILSTAAALIETRGWAQGTLETSNGCLCTLGAVRVAVAGTTVDSAISDPARDLINESSVAIQSQLGHSRVARWNDAEGRTQQEVVDTLRAAATAAA